MDNIREELMEIERLKMALKAEIVLQEEVRACTGVKLESQDGSYREVIVSMEHQPRMTEPDIMKRAGAMLRLQQISNSSRSDVVRRAADRVLDSQQNASLFPT